MDQVEVIAVEDLKEVFDLALLAEQEEEEGLHLPQKADILTASSTPLYNG